MIDLRSYVKSLKSRIVRTPERKSTFPWPPSSNNKPFSNPQSTGLKHSKSNNVLESIHQVSGFDFKEPRARKNNLKLMKIVNTDKHKGRKI